MLRKQFFRGWPFIIPGLAVLALTVIAPIAYGFVFSLRDVVLYRFSRQVFVGFANYLDLLADPFFLKSASITLTFTVSVTFLSLLIGLVVALLLDGSLSRVKNIYAALFLLPFITTPVVAGLIWRFFVLDPEYGLVNTLLGLLGLAGPGWLIDRDLALGAVIAANTWRLAPLAFLVLYAALSTLPGELSEAARIDGAGPVRVAWNIQLPLIAPHTIFVGLVLMTSAFREFDAVYSMTSGGPARETTTLTILTYVRGIVNFDIGMANAISFTMFLMVLVLAGIYVAAVAARGQR